MTCFDGLLIKVSYWYSLSIGLSPRLWKASAIRNRCYLLYSTAVHLLAFAAIGHALSQHSYLPGGVVLQATYMVTSHLKFLSIFLLVARTWWRRRQCLNIVRDFLPIFVRIRQGGLPHKILYASVGKFLTAAATVSLTNVVFSSWHGEFVRNNTLMLSINLFLYTFIVNATTQVHFALSMLEQEFAQINRGVCDNQENIEELWQLSQRHWHTYRLTLELFDFMALPTVAISLRTFMTNVRIVYQIVLCVLNESPSDVGTIVKTILLAGVFYSDVALLVSAVDKVLTSCNKTRELLSESKDSQVPLLFAHLTTQKLAFRVCGLFEFDLRSSMRCFFSVFLHVCVLVQFQLALST